MSINVQLKTTTLIIIIFIAPYYVVQYFSAVETCSCNSQYLLQTKIVTFFQAYMTQSRGQNIAVTEPNSYKNCFEDKLSYEYLNQRHVGIYHTKWLWVPLHVQLRNGAISRRKRRQLDNHVGL